MSSYESDGSGSESDISIPATTAAATTTTTTTNDEGSKTHRKRGR
jgi:hypothetical protein